MTTLGLVGIGNWGQRYLETARTIRNCRIKYICAKTSKTLSEYPSNYIKTINYKDLLLYRDLEGVIIATPPSTHVPMAIDFLSRDIPVLIEKPVAMSVKDVVKLREVSQKHNTIVLGGHTWLYDCYIKEILRQSSAIGSLRHVDIESYNTGPTRKHVPIVWDWLPHHVSFCYELFHTLPMSVDAWGFSLSSDSAPGFDRIAARLMYLNNIQVFLKAGWASPVKKRLITLIGDRGAIVYSGVPAPWITVYRHSGSRSDQQRKETIKKISLSSSAHFSPLRNEMSAFLQNIRNNVRSVTDIDRVVVITRIVEQIQDNLQASRVKGRG
jgi:predicted dehydrogenase